MKKRIVVWALVASLLAQGGAMGVPLELSAQGPPSKGTFLALPDVFPETSVDHAKAIIYRTGEREIILINPSFATPETVAASLAVLKKVRKDRMERGLTEASVVTGLSPRKALPDLRRSAYSEVLAAVTSQPSSTLGNLGPGRWLEVRKNLTGR